MDSLADRLRLVRKENRLTQKEFGDRTLVSPSYISKIEANKEKPTDMFLRLVSLEFAIDEIWLKTGDGEMNKAPDERNREDSDFFSYAALAELKDLLETKSNVKFASYAISLNLLVTTLKGYSLSEEHLFDYLENITMLHLDIERYMQLLNSILLGRNIDKSNLVETSIILKKHLDGINSDLINITSSFLSQAAKVGKYDDNLDILKLLVT